MIYPNMSMADYHAKPEINKSALDEVHRSPAHYIESLKASRPQTDAFTIGTEVHRLVVEPDTKPGYIIKPSITRRSKAEKLQWVQFFYENGATNPDKIIEKPAAEWDAEFYLQTGTALMTESQAAECKGMSEAVLKAYGDEYLSVGSAEASIFFQHPAFRGSALPGCRIRPDFFGEAPKGLHQDDTLRIIDVKTIEDARTWSFAKAVRQRRYHVQAAFYIDGLMIEMGLDYSPHFIFLAVEKKPPYATKAYELSAEYLPIGREEYYADMERLNDCIESGEYPAYETLGDSPEVLDTPPFHD